MKLFYFILNIIFGTLGLKLYDSGFEGMGIWFMVCGGVSLIKFIEALEEKK